jgi:hypothetical protein
MRAHIRLLFLAVAGLTFVSVGTPTLYGQIHGVPSSVTSMGFGGSHSRTPGVAASVTSLGPNGLSGGRAQFGNFSGFFGTGTGSLNFTRGRHHFRHNFFPGAVPVYGIPYTQVIVVQPDDVADDDQDDYDGGPTIFDRRGSRSDRIRQVIRERGPEPAAQPAVASEPPAPVVAQPSTVIVFRDGHQAEVQNYAIVGDTLFDLTDNRSHKILLADLDLAATRKTNDARGVEFLVPGSPGQ